MKIAKTVYHNNLLTADSYTVKCGDQTKTFPRGSEKEVGAWLKIIWQNEFFHLPAFVYYNIGWDNDNVLYCKYECLEG